MRMEKVILLRPTACTPGCLRLARVAAQTAGSPIFCPVPNEDYAFRIARDWNVKASGVV
jgi:hypothetical protein